MVISFRIYHTDEKSVIDGHRIQSVKVAVLKKTRLEVIKLFSCSTQLSMKFSLFINMKMPTIVGIFIFISRAIFTLSFV